MKNKVMARKQFRTVNVLSQDSFEETMMFQGKQETPPAREILSEVYEALKQKGYDPINQLVGYFLSGDPVYITSHNNARSLIRRLERYELLEELVKSYLNNL